jgi:transcriptional regulator with XRE-family HTH domain
MAREALEENAGRGRRLKQLREQVEFADVNSAAAGAGVSSGGVLKWETGKPIERKSLQALARFYGANPRWIETGEGEMLRPSDHFLERLSELERRVAKPPTTEQLSEELAATRRALAGLATLVLEPDLDPAARQLLKNETAAARQWSSSDPHSGEPETEEATP